MVIIESSVRDDMEAYCWTKSAMEFVESLAESDPKSIVNISSWVGCIVIILGDKIHSIYPFGYEIHNKQDYINQYDKQAIANDLGCSIEDIDDWDEYSIEIKHKAA